MSTLNAIGGQYGPAYRAQYGDRMLPSHRVALDALAACRTDALGGHVYTCVTCATRRYSSHSCKNRHCPTCQQGQTQAWLARQQDLLLPVPYFLITFTLPPALRDLARRHQRQLYTLLFQASATALQHLAQDPRFLGGQIGLLGVLQTCTRDLRFHPHIHYLVPAIALASDGTLRRPRNPAFLVPVKALAILFRAKLRAALRQTALYGQVAPTTWRQAWVVNCRAVGSGAAALKYLAPDIFRVALSNNRSVSVQDDRVTFRYRDGETKQLCSGTLPALTFLGRFLQQVLPKRLCESALLRAVQPAAAGEPGPHPPAPRADGAHRGAGPIRGAGSLLSRRSASRALSGVWSADAADDAAPDTQPRPANHTSVGKLGTILDWERRW